MKILEKLKEIELKYNIIILYCTYSGSKLYGTSTPKSDLDVKFIFKPNLEDVLLKKDVEHISISPQTNVKNTKDDIDFDGYSIYKFFNLLKKSETGSIDILFSMWREDTIIYKTDFVQDIKINYAKFLNKNMSAFIGYSLGQAKRFGIKGDRYKELDDFVKAIDDLPEGNLENSFSIIKAYLDMNGNKYIKFIKAPGPRGSGAYSDIVYISVLGKLFEGRVSKDYFKERIKLQYTQFGNRTKTIAKTDSKTDWKALSHAYRIAYEVKELLETKFIEFPLKNADYILKIKQGKFDSEDIISEVQDILEEVDILLLKTDLPEQSNIDYINTLTLKLLDYSLKI